MPIDHDLLVVVKSAGIGEEPALAEKLLRGFLNMLMESGKIPEKALFVSVQFPGCPCEGFPGERRPAALQEPVSRIIPSPACCPVPVSLDGLDAVIPDEPDHLPGERSVTDEITEADHQVRTLSREPSPCSFQRWQVSVDVG